MTKTRVFFVVYGIANASLIMYGLLALIAPNILMESFSAHVYLFPENAVKAIQYLSALFRLLGFLNLILGILGVVLLWSYRISHKAWFVHIISAFSILSYLGPVIFDNTVGTIGFFEILEHVIFIAMVISGITMLKDMRNIKQGDSNEKDQPHLCFRSPGNSLVEKPNPHYHCALFQ
jgi:hypothetical protein